MNNNPDHSKTDSSAEELPSTEHPASGRAGCGSAPAYEVHPQKKHEVREPRFSDYNTQSSALKQPGDGPGVIRSYISKGIFPFRVPVVPPEYGLPDRSPKGYTLEDYLKIPDDFRAELIDGVLFDMAAPSFWHQYLLTKLSSRFDAFITKNKGSCLPLISPCDVQLNCDDKTVVQPDFMVLCDRRKLKYPRVFGAPDLVVEILSPSDWAKDIHVKTVKYKNAGVREYWIVDPDHREAAVYCFDKDGEAVFYSFSDRIPVGIWDGDLTICFDDLIRENWEEAPVE